MATTYMVLTLPTVGGDTDAWGALLNTAISAIDAHDHTTGKGTTVPSAGLNINADLEFNANDATELRTARFDSGVVSLAASDVRCLYHVGGELYYRDAALNAVRITLNGAIDASTIGGITGMGGTTAAVTFSNSAKYFAFTQNTNVPANIDAGFVFVREPVSAGKGVRLGVDAAIAADWNFTFPTAAPAGDRLSIVNSSGDLSFSLLTQDHVSPGMIVNVGSSMLAAGGAFSAAIPVDNSIPQSGEGNEIHTFAYTPKKSGNKLIIEVEAQVGRGNNTTATTIIAALFRDAVADAMASAGFDCPAFTGVGAYDMHTRLKVYAEYTAPSTSAITFKLRLGSSAGSGCVYGAVRAGSLGDTCPTVIKVTEVAV